MRANNLTLLTDLYELTMMQGYFKNPTDQTVVFDMFYRDNPCGGGFAICAGLEQVIEYIENLRFTDADIEYLRGLSIFEEDFLEYLRSFHFTGDIYAIPEGTVIFPREPMVKVVAPIMEAQLVETAILNIMNHQSLIATKAARVCYAAKGDGTIRVFEEMREEGIQLKKYGIRIDSGDLAYLSKEAYKMLSAAGFDDATISASSDLDEYLIESLKAQDAKINSWGVGTRLITSNDNPAFGGVYKLAAVKNPETGEFVPKIKLSENTAKVTNPGNKTVYRIYSKSTGKIKADLICLADEKLNPDETMVVFDPVDTWKKTKILGGTYEVRELLVPVIKEGKRVYTSPSVMELRAICQKEQSTLWDESRRFSNPQKVYVDLSPKLFEVKRELIEEMSRKD